jgi:hypothetical protein
MCRPVTCGICGKTTWTGCGRHVDQVKAAVPPGQWCSGHDDHHHSDGPRMTLLQRLRRFTSG